MTSVSTSTQVTSREPQRNEQRDPRLPVAHMFDPKITRRLWNSIPVECRRNHFDKETMPEIYLSAVQEVNAGGPWTACYLNFRDLPKPLTQEIAWLIHREVEVGHFVNPNVYNAMFRILRAATGNGTRRGRGAQSLLELTSRGVAS